MLNIIKKTKLFRINNFGTIELTDKHKTDRIADLIRMSDRYVYHDLLGGRANTRATFRAWFPDQSDTFRLENVTVARVDDEIVGVAVAFDPSLSSSFSVFLPKGCKKGKRWDTVIKEYFDAKKEQNKNNRGTYILAFAVIPKYRNQGIGTELFQYILEEKEKPVSIDIMPDNIPMIKIVEKANCGLSGDNNIIISGD